MQKEKTKYQNNVCMWNVEKWCRSTYLQGRNRDADPETGHVDMMGQAVG